MKLLVGLGNTGRRYALNRHNVGFMALDAIARDLGADQWSRKFQGELASSTVRGEKVLLLKPATGMNRSGQSVGETMRYYRISSEHVLVFHDEIDLVPGKVRVKRGGGHAGHNGLRSLNQHIGADYWRIRLGVGHPGRKELVVGYVLGNFSKTDRESWLPDLLSGLGDGLPCLLKGEAAKFLNALALARNRSGSDLRRPAGDLSTSSSDEESVESESQRGGWIEKLGKIFH